MTFDKLISFYLSLNKPIKILVTVIAAVLFNFLIRNLVKVPSRIETRRTKTFLSFIRSILTVVIFFIGIAIVLSILGVNITPLIASAGIFGLAVGFGSQTLVKDIIAGLLLLAEDSISIGDLVEINGISGLVQQINIRTIILKDNEGALHIIPAGIVTSVTNLSKGEARINVDIPVRNTVKIDKIYKIIKDEIKILSNDSIYKDLLNKRASFKGIEEMKPGQFIIRTVFYTKTNNQWKIKREFFYRVIRRLEKEEIQLA